MPRCQVFLIGLITGVLLVRWTRRLARFIDAHNRTRMEAEWVLP